jgi:beta-galactosidase/beta-glucuronidase
VSANLPRPEYPRPQLRRRRWCNLNGTWRFAFDDNDRGWARGWQDPRAPGPDNREGPLGGEIIVPFCPQSPLSGIGDPSFHDVVWYARAFIAPRPSEQERIVLHFGAVDYRAAVWVNGQLVVTHEGGHTPFCADITNALSATANVLVVRAEDPGDDPTIPRGKQDWHRHPSHTFYNRTTGIWQTVWLEVVDRAHVSELRLTPDLDAAALRAVVRLDGWEPGTSVRLVATSEGQLAGAATVAAAAGEAQATVGLTDTPLRLWSPERPALYDLTVEVVDTAGHVRDRVTSYFGMRQVDVAGDRLLLNGNPMFLRLVLDQGYWPDGLLTAPSDQALRRDIELAMAMGFNGARKHQKVEDPRWLYWADRRGFLVWGEMANAHQFSPGYVQRITREWQEVIVRDYNHPSLIAWVPINESAGCRSLGPDRRTPVGPFHAHHASAMYFLTKSLDPTRPAVSNDGWEHTHSDLCTVHDYGGPEALASRCGSVERLLIPPDDGAPVYADGHSHHGQPILVTEYGGIFRDVQVDGFDYAVVDSDDDLIRRLRALTVALLNSPIVSGFCYTQLTDVEHECNGLLTADRTPKIDLARVRDVIAAPFPQRGQPTPGRPPPAGQGPDIAGKISFPPGSTSASGQEERRGQQ